MLNVIMLSVANKQLMMSVANKPFMLSVFMLNVVMLNVVAPPQRLNMNAIL